MSKVAAKVTERTFYPALIELIEAQGGSGVSEVSYASVPDIVFNLLNRNWLLSVKVGEDVATLKSAFIQYQRQKDESGLNHGLILFLPSSIRATKPRQQDVTSALLASFGTCLVDTPVLKEEYRNLNFLQVLMKLKTDIGAKLESRLEKGYSLKLVIALLKQHLTDLVSTISLSDPMLLRVVTDRKLLTGISHLKADQTESVGRFLSSYIIISQILFLRLYSSATPETSEVAEGLKPVSHYSLRRAFSRILKKDYKNIYKVDVLPDTVPDYMRSGMTANVTFLILSKTNVLYLPAEAVRRKNGRDTVLIPNPSGKKRPIKKEVKTGLNDGRKVEIISGLKEGDGVLVAGMTFPSEKTKGSNPFIPWGRRKKK